MKGEGGNERRDRERGREGGKGGREREEGGLGRREEREKKRRKNVYRITSLGGRWRRVWKGRRKKLLCITYSPKPPPLVYCASTQCCIQ